MRRHPHQGRLRVLAGVGLGRDTCAMLGPRCRRGAPLLILVGGALGSCGSAAHTGPQGTAGGPISQTIQLSATRAVAGQPIAGNIIIDNLGPAINISHGCRPGYTVVLSNSTYQPVIAWPTNCAAGSFVIPTGATRLPVTVDTTYGTCSPSGSGPSSSPPCLPGEAMPPLSPGTYQARVAWSSQVPLPPASPVTVTLISAP